MVPREEMQGTFAAFVSLRSPGSSGSLGSSASALEEGTSTEVH